MYTFVIQHPHFTVHKTESKGASLVAQWLGVCLPTWGHGFAPWSRQIHLPRSSCAHAAALEPSCHNY